MALADTLAQLAPVAGTILGGPVGGAVGTLASGLIQGAQADKARKAYDKAEAAIPLQDPMQMAFMDKVQRRRAALEAGTDAMTSNRMMQARNAGAQVQSNIVRAGGGNVSDLLRAQNATNQAIGQAGAQAQQSALSLMNVEGNLTQSMADRAYQRQMSRANVLWQDYARRREDANRTTMASIGMLPQLGAEGGLKGLLGQGGGKAPVRTFDPFSATSPGVGTYFPGAYDAQSAPNAQPPIMQTLGSSPLPYQPLG